MSEYERGLTMYQLLSRLSTSELFVRQIPVFAIAFLIAEFFYKFHSFTLECAAFLATWFVLDALVQIVGALGRKSAGAKAAR
jgi:hypothetical protein